MTTSKHASWIDTSPYADQLDIGSVGPHDIGVDWDGYTTRPARADATVTVSSLSALWTERDSATAGDIIWLDAGDYLVDGETTRQDIPADVTIASDGARIYSDTGHDGVFGLTNAGARLTGIRFEGHSATGTEANYTQSVAVVCQADVEVDNCEFWKWSLAGISVGFATEGTLVVQPHIHHCMTYDNRWDGYGYGMVVNDGADPLIEYTFLNNNRHGLGGSGAANSSYRAYNNLHGTDGELHQIEQHPDGGDRMDVQNNELRLTTRNDGGTDARAYSQRGTPGTSATIDNNWIHNPNPPSTQPDTAGDDAIVQSEHGSADWVNVTFANNKYGSTAPSDSAIGIQTLTDLNETTPEYTLDMTLVDANGNPIEGAIDIRRL